MSKFNKVLNKKAVALRYDENKNASPIIVASGMGYMAEKIVEIAHESGVPVYEDSSLATVLSQLDLGTEIPEELYQAIVDIYVFFVQFAPGEKEEVEEVQEGEKEGVEVQEVQEVMEGDPDYNVPL